MVTSRERLLKVFGREVPDCVPVAPDTSNMIPAKMTKLPFMEELFLKPKLEYLCLKTIGSGFLICSISLNQPGQRNFPNI